MKSRIIFKKELLDIFRDRRALMMTVLLPLILYPVLFGYIGNQITDQITGPDQVIVAVNSPGDLTLLQEHFTLEEERLLFVVDENPLEALETGDADLALSVQPGERLLIRVEYDLNRTSSALAVGFFTNLLHEYSELVQQQALLEEHGIELEALSPFLVEVSVMDAAEDGGAGEFLSMTLPMLLVLLLSVGGMATAIDLFAGEKERRTFEPLLCTGARRTNILAGKLGAVTVMSIVSALASVGGMVIGYFLNPEAMTMGMNDTAGLTIPPVTLLLVVLVVIASAIFFSGLHILLSTYARSIKEATTYGSFVMIATYIPVFATMMMRGGDFEFWAAFVPVMNITACLKQVLAGIHDTAFLLVTFAVTAAFVGIVLAVGRYMFTKENIMLRS